MTKKLIIKLKEKEKEKESKKKDKKTMQRNKTVSNFRQTTPGRIKERTITTHNMSRTLKANKSMGQFLRKDKKDLDNKKRTELKRLTMTPKRGEKSQSFYTKTDARSYMEKNNRFNEKNEKKSEKRGTSMPKKEKEKKLTNKKEEKKKR